MFIPRYEADMKNAAIAFLLLIPAPFYVMFAMHLAGDETTLSKVIFFFSYWVVWVLLLNVKARLGLLEEPEE